MLVGFIRRGMANWSRNDVRLLFVPPLVLICLLILCSDLDNVIFFCLHSCTIPAMFIFLTSAPVSLPAGRPALRTLELC